MAGHGNTRRRAVRQALPITLGAALAAAAMATAGTAAAAPAPAPSGTTGPAGTGSAGTGSGGTTEAPTRSVVPSGPIVPGTPCTTSARACVDLGADEAWLITGGAVTRGPVPIKPGPPEAPTPIGTFTVQWKDPHHVSDMPNHAPMPFSVFFAAGGVAFHEGSLDNYSAGCVHLDHDDAVAFYNALSVGDQVQVRPGGSGDNGGGDNGNGGGNAGGNNGGGNGDTPPVG